MHKRIVALAIVFTIIVGTLPACANAVSDTTDSLNLQDYINNGISVIVVGNYEFTTQFTNTKEITPVKVTANLDSNIAVDLSNNIISVDSLAKLPRTYASSLDNNPTAIVISPDTIDTYLSIGDEKNTLEAMLSAGSIAYFPETTFTEMTDIFKAIANDSYNMVPVEEGIANNVTAYVFKDAKGNYYTGNIIASASTAQENIDSRIIVETIENSVYAGADPSADFNPGYGWNQLSTWHKNSYEGKTSGRTWLSEWICFFSAQTSDGNHYYAWAGEWCMEPYENWGTYVASDYVKYESDCSSQQSGIQLRDYWPKVTPSKATGTVSISAGSDGSTNFGISYNWEIEELYFNDNSSPSKEFCGLEWNFDHSVFSSYDKEVSYGKFAMIFKDTLKADSYTFHHYRDAFQVAENIFGENAGANYKSTYNFKP